MPSSDTQFKPGHSGNPNGRPKKYLTLLLEEIGAEIEPKSGKTFKELISRRSWVDAINGDKRAIEFIFDRIEGKAKESHDHNVTVATPILGGQTNVHPNNSNETPDEAPQED